MRKLLKKRWALALLAASRCLVAEAQLPSARPAQPTGPITISGTAIDDSLNMPIPDLWLYLNETKYGAVTDAQGNFTFSFPAGWKPVRGGELRILVVPMGYTFKLLRQRLDWRRYAPAHPLMLRKSLNV